LVLILVIVLGVLLAGPGGGAIAGTAVFVLAFISVIAIWILRAVWPGARRLHCPRCKVDLGD
jgi:energy-converting hydrogenase Eha subunit G